MGGGQRKVEKELNIWEVSFRYYKEDKSKATKVSFIKAETERVVEALLREKHGHRLICIDWLTIYESRESTIVEELEMLA